VKFGVAKATTKGNYHDDVQNSETLKDGAGRVKNILGVTLTLWRGLLCHSGLPEHG